MKRSWESVSARVLVRLLPGLVAATVASTSLGAQIRGSAPVRERSEWWFSGGAAAVLLGDINDGRTGTVWKFGNDPLWQLRGSLEKALDEATTLGVSIGYGRVDTRVEPFIVLDGAEGVDSRYPEQCARGCDAQTDLWSLLGTFHSGGGRGFHTLFEAQGGVMAFRNLRTRTDGSVPSAAIGSTSGNVDITGTLGAGFGYTLGDGFVLNVVQDFGIGFHSKADLPSGTGRTWRARVTRASLRFKF